MSPLLSIKEACERHNFKIVNMRLAEDGEKQFDILPPGYRAPVTFGARHWKDIETMIERFAKQIKGQ